MHHKGGPRGGGRAGTLETLSMHRHLAGPCGVGRGES